MRHETIAYNDYSSELLTQIKKGAFLTTKKGEDVNTMTIGWGGIQVIWYKPVFVVYVRYSRETYNFLQEADEFTISVPIDTNMKEELAYCGKVSFRDEDKIKSKEIALIEGRTLQTPIIKGCDLHYECKVIYKQAMEPNMINDDVKARYYPNHNYHMMFYGEIVDSYRLKGE